MANCEILRVRCAESLVSGSASVWSRFKKEVQKVWAFCVNGGGRSGLFVSILSNCVDTQLLNVCGRVFNGAVCSVFVIQWSCGGFLLCFVLKKYVFLVGTDGVCL